MLALRTAVISGNTARPSLFGSSLQQSRGFFSMGAVDSSAGTPSDWYRRAKEALAKYDDLANRVTRLPIQDVRKPIQEWLGAPYEAGTPANKMQEVLTDIREDVESYIPANVNAYQVSSRTDKIQALEAMNRDLEAMVVNAEAKHGSLPAAHGVIPPVVENSGPGWLLPVVVVAGALGIASLVTYVYGGKA